MPNRILRDWTDSERVNSLDAYSERFFTRLIMKADDYGCYYAHTSLLKANLFPLLLNEVREADISRWMAACQKAGLIALYEFNSKRFLQIIEFKQRLDKAKAKFPLPTSGKSISNDNDPMDIGNKFPPESEAESDIESETEVEAGEKLPLPAVDMGTVIYDIEQDLLKNVIIFEQICMAAGRNLETGKFVLAKYHLSLQENEKYPKARPALVAGFKKWLMTENSSINGKQKTGNPTTKQVASTGHTGL